MTKWQKAKLLMFGRVRNFGIANREALPEQSVAGKTFGQLAAVVAAIEEHLVRRAEARTDARKVKTTTRRAAVAYMKAIASTGRRVADRESGTHPFRMPTRKGATEVLSTARLFKEEAEQRKERFVELGMPPTFITDFDAVLSDLQNAIVVQQDSRAARGMAQAGIVSALALGMKLVADLDVTVANTFRTNPARLGQWEGARHLEHPTRPTRETPDASATDALTPAAPTVPAGEGAVPADPPVEVLKTAS